VQRQNVNIICRSSSSKVDRFTSGQDQNDQRPILHLSSSTFSRAEMLRFCDNL